MEGKPLNLLQNTFDSFSQGIPKTLVHSGQINFIPFLMKGSLSTFIIQCYRCNSVLAGPNVYLFVYLFIYDILFKVCFARVGRTKPKCQRGSFPHLSIIPFTLFYGMVTMKGAGDEGRS